MGVALRTFISSPGNQLQADLCRGLDTLVSFAAWRKNKWLDSGGFMSSFGCLLLDSGAFSVHQGAAVDLGEYREWVAHYPFAIAHAGLDDISGNWRRSLQNYEAFPTSFPTFHDTDPPELLLDLCAMARERGGWLGVGLQPPRSGREQFLKRTIARIKSAGCDDLHVHGWALGRYAWIDGIDSTDSTHAWLEQGKIRNALGPWLTAAEALKLAVLKVQREAKTRVQEVDGQASMF